MTGPTALSVDDLEDLSVAMADAGGLSILRRSKPGLRDQEMQDAVASLGLRLPAELATWFGWRDGSNRTAWTPANEWWSLSEAVTVNEMLRGVAADLLNEPDFGPEDVWQQHWFAFTGSGSTVLLVDTEAVGATSRVFRWQADAGLIEDGVHSVGQLVREATELFARAFFGWPAGGSNPEVLRPLPDSVPNVY